MFVIQIKLIIQSITQRDSALKRSDLFYATTPKERSYTLSQNELTLRPLEVVVDGDNVERAIKALKRKVAHEGIYKELKRRRFYEKPSVKRKRKQREAERRRRKERRRALRANVRRR